MAEADTPEEETLEEQKSKEELQKEIEDLKKEIEAHENAAMGAQYSPKQQAGHTASAKRKKDRIRILKKKLAGHKSDPKDVADVRNKTLNKVIIIFFILFSYFLNL